MVRGVHHVARPEELLIIRVLPNDREVWWRRDRALLHNWSSLKASLNRNSGGGVRIRPGKRGDRTALEQVEKLVCKGRLDVHGPTHLHFKLHRELCQLR